MNKSDKEMLERQEWLCDDSFEVDEQESIDKDEFLATYLELLDVYTEQLRCVKNVLKYLNDGNETMTLYWDGQLRKSLGMK